MDEFDVHKFIKEFVESFGEKTILLQDFLEKLPESKNEEITPGFFIPTYRADLVFALHDMWEQNLIKHVFIIAENGIINKASTYNDMLDIPEELSNKPNSQIYSAFIFP